jgi:catechol 2,3-dioxygenase-like lactoylglutathione lyase family enzyme
MIKGLHHNAYRCQDSEETRKFYEDFLGLPLAGSLEITETKTGRETRLLHTFYGMDDGSYLAFFEAPGLGFRRPGCDRIGESVVRPQGPMTWPIPSMPSPPIAATP